MENVSQNKIKINGGYPLHTFEQIEDVYKVYITNPNDRELIRRAYFLAKEKHAPQFRKSGEPYIHHLLEVSYILASLQAGPETIASGFLHDVVEDTDVTIEDLARDFNKDIANIVDSVTKIQRLKLSHKEDVDFEAEDHRKIFLGICFYFLSS